MSLDVILCGGHVLPFGRRRDGTGPRDWVRAAVDGALADAGIDAADIDAVVVASESDHLSLQLSPGALMVDELGLVPRPVLRVEGGGASGALGLRAGLMQLMSGLARCVLVIGYEHAASHLSGDAVRLLYGLSFDSDLEGWAGATATGLYALSMRLHMQRHGTTRADLAAVVVKNRRYAAANPLAHRRIQVTAAEVLAAPVVSLPYRRLDCSPLSDGAAAVVLMRAADAPRGDRPRVRFIGTGCATDHVRLGDRPEPDRFAGKAQAAAQALAMADITPAAVGVAEVYDAFSGAELQALEALGLAAPGTAAARLCDGDFAQGGRCPVNLSGGLIGQGAAPGAVGIAQAVTVARLLSGRYHAGLQPEAPPRIGLTDCHGGVATLNVVHLLQREDA